MTWERLSPILLGMRDETGEPRLYENFEAIAVGAHAHA
jgi:hypothetical protein